LRVVRWRAAAFLAGAATVFSTVLAARFTVVFAAAGLTVVSLTVAVAAALRSDAIAFSADTFRLYDSLVASVRP
jgi:hypothetical protein